VSRLPADLTGVDLLFTNLDEALALLGASPPGDDPADGAAATAAAAGLVARGVGAAVVTRGPAGAWVATASGTGWVPAVLGPVVDVTGAGDALVAGTLSRLSAVLPEDPTGVAPGPRLPLAAVVEAVAFGAEIAAETVASSLSVYPGAQTAPRPVMEIR